MHNILKKMFAASLFGATACLASVSASPVLAQGNGLFGDDSEQVIVSAPRTPYARGTLGGPIVDVSLSREVRYDDLDLRTSDGVDRLRSRISFTARTLCHRLDVLFPAETADSPPCFRQAVREAMNTAIGNPGYRP